MRLPRTVVVLAALAFSATASAATYYVATTGNDTNAGSREAPVATLGKAIALAERQPDPAEIVVRGGTYFLQQSVRIARSSKSSRLVIRAADQEIPVFDGSQPLAPARPLDGHPGVYLVEGDYPTDDPPKIWEESSGRHFRGLAALESVRVTDNSMVVLDEKTLALRCRNGMPPAEAGLRRCGPMYGLEILRDQVTVRGLHFQNFVSVRAASAVIIGGTGMTTVSGPGRKRQGTFVVGTVVDSCFARHCYLGFRVYVTGRDSLITRCRTRNTVCGVYVSGIDTTVEHGEFSNDAGFHTERLTWDYRYDRCGIRFYNQPEGAVLRHNFIQNFEQAGIHSKGSPGTYVVEHNTIVGISRSFSIDKGFQLRYNIFADNTTPFSSDLKGELEAEIDYNLFWGPRDLTAQITDEKVGGAPHNLFGDPRFAAPEQGDYRLLPGSPALGIHGDRNAGAFARVPDDFRGPPTLRVNLGRRQGNAIAVRLAVTGMAPADAMRWAVDDGPLAEEDFAEEHTVELPAPADGAHTLRLQVRDANGTWSGVLAVPVPAMAGPPRMIGAPTVVASRFGVLFSFAADHTAKGDVAVHDGRQWLEAGTCRYAAGNRTPLLLTDLLPERMYRYRLTVNGTAVEGEFNLSGPPRILYVSTVGVDAETRGARDRPLATLQYALDRALPGDRVRLMPGTYFGAYRLEDRGGTAEQPLVIEGLYPNTVVLDGLREVGTLLRLAKAPHVVLRNLNFRWYIDAAVTVSASPGVRVTGCRFVNQYWRGGSGATCRSLNFHRSPRFTVDHCVFARTRYGLSVEGSPGGRILHNTAVANSVTHVLWRGSPEDDIVIKYNSFNWNGNSLLYLGQPRETIRQRAEIDYNNYGTAFKREEGTEVPAGRYGKSLPKPFPYLPSNREFIWADKLFVNMDDWRRYSGQDTHSIYADPKWIDPRAGRFDVAADSPNLLPDGTVIGACGYVGEHPNTPPEIVLTTPYAGEAVGGVCTISAETSDFDGSVQRVEFYANDRLLGTASTPPYRLAGIKLPPGRHAIAARAVDDRGATTISDEVPLTVHR